MITEVSRIQPAKALLPIVVTELEMVSEVNVAQSENALLPILVTSYVIDAFVTVAGIFAMPLKRRLSATSTVGGLVDVTL